MTSQELRTALPILLAAMGVSAIIWLIAWRPWRRSATLPHAQQTPHWAGPLALGLGFLAAFAILAQWRGIRLTDRWHWIAPIALAAMVIGFMAATWRRRAFHTSILLACAVAIASGILLHPPPIAAHPIWWRFGFAAIVLSLWGVTEPLAQRRRGVTMPLALTIVYAGLSIVLLESRQAGFSLLAAAMAAMCGIAVLIALSRRDFNLAHGAMHVMAAVLASLTVIGWLYNASEVSIVPFVLLLAAPCALWAGELKFVGNRAAWQAVLIRLVLIALPVGVAVALAIRAASAADDFYG